MYIEVKDAVKKYGTGESELYALNHVSLTLEKGEICVILGPSGSGKSTLLNMLGGMDHLDAGSITIDGQEITKLSRKALGEYRRKKIGVVFQSYNLIPELTVRENIRVVEDISQNPLSLSELLEKLGLTDHATHFPSELSGGQQKRICIARALAADPDYIIFDEAVSGLDAAVRKSVLDLLIRIQKSSGKGFLLITHDIDAALYTSQRIAVMKSGRILETVKYEGDTAVFKSDYSAILINSSLLGIKR